MDWFHPVPIAKIQPKPPFFSQQNCGYWLNFHYFVIILPLPCLILHEYPIEFYRLEEYSQETSNEARSDDSFHSCSWTSVTLKFSQTNGRYPSLDTLDKYQRPCLPSRNHLQVGSTTSFEQSTRLRFNCRSEIYKRFIRLRERDVYSLENDMGIIKRN